MSDHDLLFSEDHDDVDLSNISEDLARELEGKIRNINNTILPRDIVIAQRQQAEIEPIRRTRIKLDLVSNRNVIILDEDDEEEPVEQGDFADIPSLIDPNEPAIIEIDVEDMQEQYDDGAANLENVEEITDEDRETKDIEADLENNIYEPVAEDYSAGHDDTGEMEGSFEDTPEENTALATDDIFDSAEEADQKGDEAVEIEDIIDDTPLDSIYDGVDEPTNAAEPTLLDTYDSVDEFAGDDAEGELDTPIVRVKKSLEKETVEEGEEYMAIEFTETITEIALPEILETVSIPAANDESLPPPPSDSYYLPPPPPFVDLTFDASGLPQYSDLPPPPQFEWVSLGRPSAPTSPLPPPPTEILFEDVEVEPLSTRFSAIDLSTEEVEKIPATKERTVFVLENSEASALEEEEEESVAHLCDCEAEECESDEEVVYSEEPSGEDIQFTGMVKIA